MASVATGDRVAALELRLAVMEQDIVELSRLARRLDRLLREPARRIEAVESTPKVVDLEKSRAELIERDRGTPGA
jgi:hypothetical protein